MLQSLWAVARSLPSTSSPAARARLVGICLAGALGVVGVSIGAGGSATAASTCDLSATPSSFASALSSASAGQTICLASGSYGTFAGTSKQVTIAAADGASPTMKVNVASGDANFTLDGMTGMGGTIAAGASGITIRNSTFTSTIDVEGAIQHVVLDGDHFDWPAVSTTGGPNAKIFVSVSGASPGAALTVENSTILNGDLDGVNIGGGSGLLVQGNEFENLCDRNVNHTDNIQFEGGSQIRVAGNYVYESQSCNTQGITSYDGGTDGVIFEDSVVDIPRDWGIELYADQNSIVRHNTVVYHPKTYSEFNTGTGQIDIDRKTQDPAGSGTEVYDNIATSVAFTNGSTGTAHNNVSGQSAIYVGPTTTYPGFQLASNSPVGLNAADDGTDDGVRVNTTTTTNPPPLPPPPTDTPAQA